MDAHTRVPSPLPTLRFARRRPVAHLCPVELVRQDRGVPVWRVHAKAWEAKP